MKGIVKDALILFAITLVAALSLALTNGITQKPIAKQQIINRDKAFLSVLSDSTDPFEEMTGDFTNYPQLNNVFAAKANGELIGYAFKCSNKEGYGGLIEVVVGIDLTGTITGIDIIKHSETPGLGAKADTDAFKSQYSGKAAQTLSVNKKTGSDTEVVAISGATITSRAVTNAVNEAIAYYNDVLAKEGK